MAGIFKAYDVRGVYPTEINEQVARKIGLAFHHILDAEDRAMGNTVIVSRDMRSHSVPLAEAGDNTHELLRGGSHEGLRWHPGHCQSQPG